MEVEVVGQTPLLIWVEALVPSYPSVWAYAIVYTAANTASPIPHAPPENTILHHE